MCNSAECFRSWHFAVLFPDHPGNCDSSIRGRLAFDSDDFYFAAQEAIRDQVWILERLRFSLKGIIKCNQLKDTSERKLILIY
jgi:hypothetical protein